MVSEGLHSLVEDQTSSAPIASKSVAGGLLLPRFFADFSLGVRADRPRLIVRQLDIAGSRVVTELTELPVSGSTTRPAERDCGRSRTMGQNDVSGAAVVA
jgi:hypothetical protein